MTLKVGYASRDITPSLPITTSGFISRCNEPVKTVRDPLHVRCLVFEYGDLEVVFIVYDLLGVGDKLHDLIQNDLDQSGMEIPRSQRILCCTHTHSAPSTMQLLGCGIPDENYWNQLRKATQEVCVEARNDKKKSTYRTSSVDMMGLAYDRTLSESRTIASVDDSSVYENVGSAPTTMNLVRFDDENNNSVAGIVHWAAHPVLSEGDTISADYPSQLCSRLEERFNMPFIFFQGAAGNINPLVVSGAGDRISNYISEIMKRVDQSSWSQPEACNQLYFSETTIYLQYEHQFTQKELKKLQNEYQHGTATGTVSKKMFRDISKVLNIKADGSMENRIVKHTCQALSQWTKNWAEKSEKEFHRPCDMSVKVLNLDRQLWYFVAAEPYSDLQNDLQAALPDKNVHIIGYASPMQGYIPILDEKRQDGYELEYAYRFYNHPGPFAKKSNRQILEDMLELIRS